MVEKLPDNLSEISKKDSEEEKRNKILGNALKRENFQRNFCFKELKNFSGEDLVLINDLDEIPNLEKFNYKNKISIFKQEMFYYKLNLKYPNYDWMGSKICKIKHLKNPQWLRNVKSKKYPLWRLDILADDRKFSNIEIIDNGGWHFTNIMSAEKIDHKMRNFLHHLEYEESGFDKLQLKKLISEKRIMYDHSKDKKSGNKWRKGKSLVKIN